MRIFFEPSINCETAMNVLQLRRAHTRNLQNKRKVKNKSTEGCEEPLQKVSFFLAQATHADFFERFQSFAL